MARPGPSRRKPRVSTRPKKTSTNSAGAVTPSSDQATGDPSAAPTFPTASGSASAAKARPITLVGTLSGHSLETPSYRMPAGLRKELISMLGHVHSDGSPAVFVDELAHLIARYEVFRRQDRETSRSEREALTHLAHAHDRARELVNAYAKAKKSLPGAVRLQTAFSALQAARPTHLQGIPIKRPGPPPSLGQLEESLLELKGMLSIAASLPLTRRKGGRPRQQRERDFVIEFHKRAKERLGDPAPSIRTDPLKRVLSIALQEVGWIHDDVRPLLNAVERPLPRKKPPA